MSVYAECDECGKDTLHHKFSIYCEVCYDRLGDKIKDLQFENEELSATIDELKGAMDRIEAEISSLKMELQNALAL